MEIKKPINESRILKGDSLESGIKYINVQDVNLDRSHVMVSVNIGSISDPFEYQGLAHFLEHMLFLGSKKYPGENQFEKFLNENGRQLIGWDEILEGGLAPSATVQSWRGEEGGDYCCSFAAPRCLFTLTTVRVFF